MEEKFSTSVNEPLNSSRFRVIFHKNSVLDGNDVLSFVTDKTQHSVHFSLAINGYEPYKIVEALKNCSEDINFEIVYFDSSGKNIFRQYFRNYMVTDVWLALKGDYTKNEMICVDVICIER
jgi:hypothetical protein